MRPGAWPHIADGARLQENERFGKGHGRMIDRGQIIQRLRHQDHSKGFPESKTAPMVRAVWVSTQPKSAGFGMTKSDFIFENPSCKSPEKQNARGFHHGRFV